jgi:hypothetical protein
MQELDIHPANPELKEIVVEASRALARLDAPRLDELALSCQALTRQRNPENAGERKLLVQQAQEAEADMAVFARVLDATRANLSVMKRLHELRVGRLEYTERQARGAGAVSPLKSPRPSADRAEGKHGDH